MSSLFVSEFGVKTSNPLGFSEDHITPRVQGGVDSKENIRPAHLFCNESRGSKTTLNESYLSYLRSIIEDLKNSLIIETVDSNIITCAFCEEEFYAENARILKYKKKYCTESCRDRAMERRVVKQCLQCKNLFEIRGSRDVNNRGKYCSKICYSKSSNGVERICITCEKVYYVSESNKRRSVVLYCSKCRKIKI